MVSNVKCLSGTCVTFGSLTARNVETQVTLKVIALLFLSSQKTVVHLGELSCLKQGRRRREAE